MKRSPLEELYPDSVQFTSLNGFNVPRVYSNFEYEYNLLRHKIGIIDGVGFGIFEVNGNGASVFLDRLATKDVSYLNSGKVCECYFLSDDATIIGFVYIINDDEKYTVVVPPENHLSVYNWLLEKGTDVPDVNILNVTELRSAVFIEGEKSWEVIRDTFDFPIETLALRDMEVMQFSEHHYRVSRIGRSGEYAYCVISDSDSIRNFTDYCLSNFKDMGLDFCGYDALSICMLEVMQPFIVNEIVGSGNIIELNYQWLVQYDKENYIGYDQINDMLNRKINKRTVAFCAENVEKISENAGIFIESDSIGRVIFARYSPSLESVIGIAILDSQYAVSGISVVIQDNDTKYVAETKSSPLVRPLSWDSRIE